MTPILGGEKVRLLTDHWWTGSVKARSGFCLVPLSVNVTIKLIDTRANNGMISCCHGFVEPEFKEDSVHLYHRTTTQFYPKIAMVCHQYVLWRTDGLAQTNDVTMCGNSSKRVATCLKCVDAGAFIINIC
jgi:hypothetical protein